MASRKRSDSGSRRPLKEKVVQIYESFFQGEDLSINNPNFWDEFFLLKPKVSNFEMEVDRLSPEQLLKLKDNINVLFTQCVNMLGHEHNIRIVYAIQTLCALMSSVLRKQREHCVDIITVLLGLDGVEKQMKHVIRHCNTFLAGDQPASLKSLCLKLVLIIVTGLDNINQNNILEYLMLNNMFETLVQLLTESKSCHEHGGDVILLLTFLVNYRKHEAINPYIVKLSILDNELALNGYARVIRSCLDGFCTQFAMDQLEPQSGGSWLSSLTTMVGSMFVPEDNQVRTQQIRANNAVLLALYEGVHLNRNFMTSLAHVPLTPGSPPQDTNDEMDGGNLLFDVSTEPNNAQTSNLLVTLFQYCSIVMQETRSEGAGHTCKLCLLILNCIAEDPTAASIMHDPSLRYRVPLARVPMRHRKISVDCTPHQTLVAVLIDLVTEFLMSHMSKVFPIELYMLAVGIIHRILCYQKSYRVRSEYSWRTLWSVLITLLKFLQTNEAHLAKKMNIFHLALQVINIFNLFITYGDTFLPSPSCYDELYYEIIRVHVIFDSLYSVAFKHSSIESQFKQSALVLTNSLINVRAIINHLAPKIDAWLAKQALSTPSEDQILEIVRANYDSLTLKLQDNLDQFERYSENPRHVSFFTYMVRNVVSDSRSTIEYHNLDLQQILHDFSSIT
uniref:UPF0668 protein C10orf76 homolog n=2 Tax=Cacopsylla melanoneura TaxID=428564 RepID=A0A8D8LKT2_9HEMI